MFDDYFDTRVGHKHEVASYRAIAERIGPTPNEILFLSDTERELDAAREAGMTTCQLVRDAKPMEGLPHPQVPDFDSIAPIQP
uniref:Haloacid dehalogenase superfamily, subfamily IA, variant 3 with third motif having DD or ED n=1 Tax=Candidatus Kentrum sp. LFY TaxID=2126342 RepID=A0A450WV98_9GAMM|nr:MAG: haloacid dehalogenase superfamily, subfamily IA, variant 3 with third motif having DD or ED [Candidatus Kentron sp. LFY]